MDEVTFNVTYMYLLQSSCVVGRHSIDGIHSSSIVHAGKLLIDKVDCGRGLRINDITKIADQRVPEQNLF
jgi:hypothetical protein